jgi:hypothetical protein
MGVSDGEMKAVAVDNSTLREWKTKMTNFMKELKKLKLNDTHIIFLSL